MPLFGTLATISSLFIILFGLPRQIISNYRRKSCAGFDSWLIYTMCIAYTMWCVYGWTKPDLFLKISQTPGCILSYIVLFQYIYYHKKVCK